MIMMVVLVMIMMVVMVVIVFMEVAVESASRRGTAGRGGGSHIRLSCM